MTTPECTPPARGSSHTATGLIHDQRVHPASAGIAPVRSFLPASGKGTPRQRRGSPTAQIHADRRGPAHPADVGIIHHHICSLIDCSGWPRRRGDNPGPAVADTRRPRWPRRRGGPPFARHRPDWDFASLPADAGVHHPPPTRLTISTGMLPGTQPPGRLTCQNPSVNSAVSYRPPQEEDTAEHPRPEEIEHGPLSRCPFIGNHRNAGASLLAPTAPSPQG